MKRQTNKGRKKEGGREKNWRQAERKERERKRRFLRLSKKPLCFEPRERRERSCKVVPARMIVEAGFGAPQGRARAWE